MKTRVLVLTMMTALVAWGCDDDEPSGNGGGDADDGGDGGGDGGLDTDTGGGEDTAVDSDEDTPEDTADVPEEVGEDTVEDGADVAEEVVEDVVDELTDVIEETGDVTDASDTNDADAGPTWPGLEEIGEMCGEFCEDADDCEALDLVGGEDCLADCAESFAENGAAYVANVTCVNEIACEDFEDCLGDLEVPEECQTLCEEVNGCGYGPFMDLADPAACEPTCTGAVLAEPGEPGEFVECMNTALEDGCNILGMFECVEEPLPACSDICELVGTCADESPVGADFADVAACETYCGELDSDYHRAQLHICLNGSGGDCNAVRCNEVPEELPESCVTGCGDMLDVCSPDPMALGELCEEVCVGVGLQLPVVDAEGFVECATGLDECIEEIDGISIEIANGYSSQMIYCLLNPSEGCVASCEALQCNPEAGSRVVCEMGCGARELFEPDYGADLAECMADVLADNPEDCVGVYECVPPPPTL